MTWKFAEIKMVRKLIPELHLRGDPPGYPIGFSTLKNIFCAFLAENIFVKVLIQNL